MNTVGFFCAVIAAILFGVGGTFAQFLFENRDINLQWLVSIRLLGGGTILLAFAAARDGHGVLAPLRDKKDAIQLLIFGVLGMLSVQYTYFAAIKESNTATATVMQYTAPAMIAVWMAMRTRRWPSGKEYAAIALALTGTFFLVTHGDFSALSTANKALLSQASATDLVEARYRRYQWLGADATVDLSALATFYNPQLWGEVGAAATAPVNLAILQDCIASATRVP